MLPTSLFFLIPPLLTALSNASPVQHQFTVSQPLDESKPRRPLRGRFLHLTDIHPDPHFRVGGTESTACHRKKPKKEKERGSYYGLPYGDCDSPLTLTNLTLDYLEKHWAKEIDFVIWTGDSARHDNDREIPRTPNEIYDSNRAVVRRMNEIFTDRGIPVVPSLGNNDIWPHNILPPGPNSITNEFANIWRTFIPFESYQVFQRGAYYSVEVIPNELAVISLNTMYFYDSNKAVEGCEYNDKDDAGNLEFDWLEVQLDRYRERGMQVWLSGHVPPSPGNYFPGCFVRYADVALRYQDTILGHLYGHMNVDHFFFLHTEDLILPDAKGEKRSHKITNSRSESLAESLISEFEQLPKAGKTDLDEYAVINVSPSVVPNPYLPTFRVYSYNITEAGGVEVEGKRNHKHRHPGPQPEVDCKKKENKDTWACRPKKPHHTDSGSPSRANRLWTPLGYAQYWLPDLETARPRFKLEYLTFAVPSLHPESGEYYPVPLRELPKSLRSLNRTESKYAPYGLADLTLGSWLGFARRLGNEKEKKIRKLFVKYMYQQ